MSYYVRMKVENHILDRYGFEALIHATIQDKKEVFYAKLFKGAEYDECEEYLESKFETFTEAHNFLFQLIKDRLTPYVDTIRLKGKWAAEDLETIQKDFNL